MKLNKLTLTGFIMSIFFASCNSFNPEKIAKNWDVVQIGTEAVTPSAVTPYVSFENGKIHGYTGCNHINGGIQISGKEFSAGNMAMTMRTCPEAKYEQGFVQAINEGKIIKATENGFELQDKNNKSLLSFTPRILKVEDLEGQWNLAAFNGKDIEQNEETAFLIFDFKENRLAGFTGCNRLTAALDKDMLQQCKIDLSDMGMTRKLCQNHVFEAKFVEALNKSNVLRIFNGQLYIYGENDTLVFSKKK